MASPHSFRVIAVPPPTSRCVVAALWFSPMAAAIFAVLLTLFTLREGGHCTKLVFQLQHYENLSFIGGVVRSEWFFEVTITSEKLDDSSEIECFTIGEVSSGSHQPATCLDFEPLSPFKRRFSRSYANVSAEAKNRTRRRFKPA
jgi:hypothetical protein